MECPMKSKKIKATDRNGVIETLDRIDLGTEAHRSQ